MGEIDLSRGAVLEKGCVYVVPLQEELALASGIAAKATPKSTAGRLGLFTRLLADHAEEFDRVPAGYAGRLYAEVVPRAFSVLVREGARLGQIRFLKGDPESPDSRLGKLHLDKTLVCGEGGVRAEARIRDGLWITIDLAGGASPSTAGYRARQNAPLIDLEKTDFYDPVDFWEALPVSPGKSLVLNPGDFHILVSRERVRVPPTHAAVMVPYEPSIGEFRVHYAGFFDPGFGYGEGDIPGTPAVLEVLSHEAPFLLEHGQIVGRLVYERLSERPERVYGPGIGSSYQFQALGLSKQFRRTAGPALTP
jgi:dCTP deaminase